MALRENERRILAQIEHRLSQDDPELAGHLTSFGADDPGLIGEERRGGGWKPWAVCGLIAAVVVGLLVMLFTVTPGRPTEATPQPSSAPEAVVPDAAQPEAEPAR
ncbi:hypothetical protein HDA32_003387 [Spinactinospora alkalitolerans]|uniref:DUF3040 domain-containing protein n=1 Tax=Spinactinospora alkalitolerans TaxID=687207 RepID=A0A852TYA9_9ACTN|nr:DUF3040 domain-containing protein [Spinactinospora alkalitolerans]NYE48267.1 hypothetical protein [Spinactinospora alkalitolerans]